MKQEQVVRAQQQNQDPIEGDREPREARGIVGEADHVTAAASASASAAPGFALELDQLDALGSDSLALAEQLESGGADAGGAGGDSPVRMRPKRLGLSGGDVDGEG